MMQNSTHEDDDISTYQYNKTIASATVSRKNDGNVDTTGNDEENTVSYDDYYNDDDNYSRVSALFKNNAEDEEVGHQSIQLSRLGAQHNRSRFDESSESEDEKLEEIQVEQEGTDDDDEDEYDYDDEGQDDDNRSIWTWNKSSFLTRNRVPRRQSINSFAAGGSMNKTPLNNYPSTKNNDDLTYQDQSMWSYKPFQWSVKSVISTSSVAGKSKVSDESNSRDGVSVISGLSKDTRRHHTRNNQWYRQDHHHNGGYEDTSTNGSGCGSDTPLRESARRNIRKSQEQYYLCVRKIVALLFIIFIISFTILFFGIGIDRGSSLITSQARSQFQFIFSGDTSSPSLVPSDTPTMMLSHSPSVLTSAYPSVYPSQYPSFSPSTFPSFIPSTNPSKEPTQKPTWAHSHHPSKVHSEFPSTVPSAIPTKNPTRVPSPQPTKETTLEPSPQPTKETTLEPSPQPTKPRLKTLHTTMDGEFRQSGNMFDIYAKSGDIQIKSIDIHVISEGEDIIHLEVWVPMRSNTSYRNIHKSRLSWRRLFRTSLNGKGENKLTHIPSKHFVTNPITIKKGEIQGIYITLTEPHMLYSKGTSKGGDKFDARNVYVENDDIDISEGAAKVYLFRDSYEPRVWNGNINYEVVMS